MPKKGGKGLKRGAAAADGATTRIAVVNEDRCKPKKCGLECSRNCPVNRLGKICIEVKKTSKVAFISEILCIGCNICVKKCPFEAITIINLPSNLESCTTHRFGPNSFKLHRLPTPRSSQVLGLVGTNGIGKSTALKILSGKLKPNLGRFKDPPEWVDIIRYYRGSELQSYLQNLLEDQLSAVMKPQYVDHIPKKMKAVAIKKGNVDDAGKPILPKVKEILKKKDQREIYKQMLVDLDLKHIRNRQIHHLSGGELQRLAIATCAIRDEDVYMFDEPSSYLDVKQRLKAGAVIRELVSAEEDQRRMRLHGHPKSAYVICVEHDLAILDYLSDFVCVLYGTPGVFGVVTMPFGVREGINIFLAGHIPTENMRFREFELSFKVSDTSRADLEGEGDEKKEEDVPTTEKGKKKAEKDKKLKERADKRKDDQVAKDKAKAEKDAKSGKRSFTESGFFYPNMKKVLDTFQLQIDSGYFRDSEIVVMLGENGTGKTTFVKMLAGLLKPEPYEDGTVPEVPELRVSYKPQTISPTFEGSVYELLMRRIRSNLMHPGFQTDVYKPMSIKELEDRRVTTLSGGELQRVALVLALGTPADVYLIDEPSAYLDSEQRIIASKVIKRFILHSKKAAFVVEHDFIMATYLADRVIVFDGVPGRSTRANQPQSLMDGMNAFLKQLDVTFRRDPVNYRPRINKRGSQKDQEQKATGNYFFLDSSD